LKFHTLSARTRQIQALVFFYVMFRVFQNIVRTFATCRPSCAGS